MRPLLIGVALALCLSAHLSHAAPAGTDLAAEHQETLETLHLGEPGSDDTTVRDKRTIGPLRQLFPGLSQIVDRKIQQITRSLFRVIGRLVLGGGGGGGNSATAGASSSSSSGRKVSITLPTYPPGEDDDDEDEDEDSTQAASTVSPSDESSTPVKIHRDTDTDHCGSALRGAEVVGGMGWNVTRESQFSNFADDGSCTLFSPAWTPWEESWVAANWIPAD